MHREIITCNTTYICLSRDPTLSLFSFSLLTLYLATLCWTISYFIKLNLHLQSSWFLATNVIFANIVYSYYASLP